MTERRNPMRPAGRIVGLLALLLVGCSGVSKLDCCTLGRASWQRPEEVVKALDLEPGQRVADLGAGKGYFEPYLAEAVGPRGRVYAVEVETELVQQLSERFSDEPDNVEIVRGRYDDPELPDGAIDVVLIVNTYHHIEDREQYFARLRSDLTSSGRVAIIEPDAELRGVLSLFHHEGHTSSSSKIVAEMAAAGYAPSASFDFLPTQVFEVFSP